MAEEIKDGTGTGNKVKVTADNRLAVSSKANPRPYYVSRDFYIKNTSSTRNLLLHAVEFHSVENVKWKIWHVSGTAVGTLITPTNLNLGSGLPAEAICMGNAAVTGLTELGQVGAHRTTALSEAGMEFSDALILTPGTAVAVEYDTGTTGIMELDVFFYFEDIL